MYNTVQIGEGHGNAGKHLLSGVFDPIAIHIGEQLASYETNRLVTNCRWRNGGRCCNRNGFLSIGGGEDGVGRAGHHDGGRTNRDTGEVVRTRSIGYGSEDGAVCIGERNGNSPKVGFTEAEDGITVDIGEDLARDGALQLEAHRSCGCRFTGGDGYGLRIIGGGYCRADWIGHVHDG